MGGSLSGIALKDLLEAGVHFGHQTKRWNPKMKQFIFGERNGIYIIDLAKTAKLFREAEQFTMNLAAEGRTILFVGTKRQAQDAIAEEAQRCGMYFVNQRWLGGLLTNFSTIQRSLARLRDLEEIAMRHQGVDKVYAMHAGREVRVIVRPEDIDDDGATLLSHQIAREVEKELEYPGQIKVTVIRESRASDYAR